MNFAGDPTEQAGFANFASPGEQAGFANFADFEDTAVASPAGNLREEEPQTLSASPPKIQRRPSSRQSSLKSTDTASVQGSSEVASLRKLVADLQSQVQQLQATTKNQQVTIKQLQVRA